MVTTIDPTTAEDIALGPYSTDCTISVMQPPRSSLLLVEQFELGRVPQGEGNRRPLHFRCAAPLRSARFPHPSPSTQRSTDTDERQRWGLATRYPLVLFLGDLSRGQAWRPSSTAAISRHAAHQPLPVSFSPLHRRISATFKTEAHEGLKSHLDVLGEGDDEFDVHP